MRTITEGYTCALPRANYTAPKSTVTFNLGYCNYKTFGNFCEQGVLFVTRLKENAKYEVLEVRETDCEQVPSDETIIFTGTQTKKKCPYRLRRITSIDKKTGHAITILTNIFTVSAAYIAKMYRARWHIEIFFKTIKQNLRIKKFYGQTENAVKTQIWIALIVYLLFLKLCEQCKYDDKNFTYFCLYFESGSQPLLNIPSPFLFNR